ncbi:NUDIX hydrolase [Aphanothece sacrum]|uniref:NUDIX hydrolase n=1 Tax=Aphanothece sacrum TaxID=1122 RepID=UPI000F607D6C|nr:NUDIX hydrolase [Aphanothece sacrum]
MISSFPTNVTSNNSPSPVALAILYQDNQCLLQLRDDLPTILYPGHWGLFGGHLEPGESPEAGLKREILEEISYVIDVATEFRCYADDRAVRYIYHAPLTIGLEELDLQEGADLALASLETIQQGQCYSTKIEQVRPLGDIHQRILLDFFESRLK